VRCLEVIAFDFSPILEVGRKNTVPNDLEGLQRIQDQIYRLTVILIARTGNNEEIASFANKLGQLPMMESIRKGVMRAQCINLTKIQKMD
jgi:hypothetical protein